MDHAVALVQAYLQVNGYFTVAEFPVLARLPGGGFKSATDIDLLALRLRGSRGGAVAGGSDFEPDPELEIPDVSLDVLLIEVKEGRAELNRSAKNPEILRSVLARFGLDDHTSPKSLSNLERHGEGRWPGDVAVRMLAFGSVVDPAVVRGFRAISLPHVTRYLSTYLDADWEALRHAHFRDAALGLLALFEQVRRTPPRSAADTEPEAP